MMSMYRNIKRIFTFAALLLGALLTGGTSLVWAAGTSAGAAITSSTTVNYKQAGIAQAPLTASVNFLVDRVVNLVVTKNGDATVSSGSTNQALVYLVTNTSNTAMRFSLQAVSRGTNTWSMNNVRIYRDTNGNGAWDAGDVLYVNAGTFGDVAPNGGLAILIVADAPAGLGSGQTAQYDLVATAVDAGTVNSSAQTAGPNTLPGVETVLADSAGSAAGDAARDGKHSATGSFTVGAAVAPVVTMTKAVAVIDQWGGNLPIPGATLRYTITVTANGTARNVVVTDPLPQNTTYIPNSLRVNGNPLTDAADGDAGDVGGAAPNTVTVRLGDMIGASIKNTITFDVKIQ